MHCVKFVCPIWHHTLPNNTRPLILQIHNSCDTHLQVICCIRKVTLVSVWLFTQTDKHVAGLRLRDLVLCGWCHQVHFQPLRSCHTATLSYILIDRMKYNVYSIFHITVSEEWFLLNHCSEAVSQYWACHVLWVSNSLMWFFLKHINVSIFSFTLRMEHSVAVKCQRSCTHAMQQTSALTHNHLGPRPWGEPNKQDIKIWSEKPSTVCWRYRSLSTIWKSFWKTSLFNWRLTC